MLPLVNLNLHACKFILCYVTLSFMIYQAAIAQLGERQTEDLKVSGSTPGLGIGSLFHGDEFEMKSMLKSEWLCESCGQVAIAKTRDAKRCDKTEM